MLLEALLQAAADDVPKADEACSNSCDETIVTRFVRAHS